MLAEVHNPYIVKLLYSFQVREHFLRRSAAAQESTVLPNGLLMQQVIRTVCLAASVYRACQCFDPPIGLCRMTSICTSSWSTSPAVTSWCVCGRRQISDCLHLCISIALTWTAQQLRM